MEEAEAQGIPLPVRLAFRVSYFGGNFMGSQLQPELRTIEGEFIHACTRLGLFTDWREAGFSSSGRTDRGVHARSQVIAFSTLFHERAGSVLNMQLPGDLWCNAYAVVSHEFHPRYDAKWRTYRYYFHEEGLDGEAMKKAAGLFEGAHNFSGFAKISDKDPVRRVVSVSLGEERGIIYFEVTAESFLWHMVRCMASSLIGVGAGACEATTIKERLDGHYEKGLQPAPPEGLILWDVGYENVEWRPMPAGERRIAEIKDRKGNYKVMSRMCEIFADPPVSGLNNRKSFREDFSLDRPAIRHHSPEQEPEGSHE